MGSKTIGKLIAPVAGAVLGSFVPGIGTALGAALGSGAGTLASGGNLGQAALSAGGSYLGGSLGGSFLGGSTIGNSLVNTFGDVAGNTIAGGLGSLADTTLGAVGGSFAGNSLANNISGANLPKVQDSTNFQSFKPSQQDLGDLPASLSGFGGLDQNQQTSNIANKGVFGGGLGPDEQKYFLNLINRQLVDKSGQTQGMNSLSPIEGSYLQQLGLGGKNNTNDLLQAISQWHS